MLTKIKQYSLQHSIEIIDSIIKPDSTYIIMKLINNNLEQLMGREGIDWKNIFYQLCVGVAELHNIDILHSDLKPSNILITNDYHVLIADFGLARTYSRITNGLPYEKIGTLPYRAPEIFFGGDITSATDIWSLGTILYQIYLIMGKKSYYPFGRKGFTEKQIVKDIFKYIGIPSDENWPRIHTLPEWKKYKYLTRKVRNTEEQTYIDELTTLNIDNNIIDLIGKMLILNPAERPTIYEVLQHSFFNNNLVKSVTMINCLDSLKSDLYYPSNI